MDPENRRLWLVVLGLVIALGLFLLFGTAREQLLPVPKRAWVAIETGGSGVARLGRVEVEPGARYTLHAVLEAESWQGEPLFYTEAERLELPSGEVESGSLRPWPGDGEVRILWFSVEGAKPFVEVASLEELEAFEFREYFRADWPRSWSVPGSWGATSAGVRLPDGVTDLPFGTRRFQVRIELFGPESQIRPRERFASPGAARLVTDLEGPPTVVSTLGGPLAAPSRVFGLPQIEPTADSGAELRRRLVDWTRRGLAFSRLAVIRAALDDAGVEPEDLAWEPTELNGSTPWGDPGDLLRAGQRWVFTYEDRGERGALDYDDLCVDFDKGAAIRRLGDIFTGEGLVERARLGGAGS